jgi:hypothetical protein
MRKLKLTLAGISTSFVLTTLLMCFSTSAFAAGIGANVQAGTTVTATTSDANISHFTLNGHTRNATYDLPITVVDSRGDASGWSLTMTSTIFATSDDSHELAADASTISAIALAAPDGTLPVASAESVVTAIPAGTSAPTAVKIFSADAGSGMGTTTVTPTVHIAIPGSAYAGSYTSTVTIGTNLAP